MTVKSEKSRKIVAASHDKWFYRATSFSTAVRSFGINEAVDGTMRERVMFSRRKLLATSMLFGSIIVSSFGCASSGPFLGVFGVPIPVSPYFADQAEDRFVEHERYDRVPILGPITSGGPAVALDPPSDDEVIRTLERTSPVEGGIPFFSETHRDNVRIVKSLIADYVDPPRFYPLIGPAQLHHAHYKCTVYYTETKRKGWPNPHTLVDEEEIEVLYIDHNHLHIVGDVDGGPDGNYSR